MLATTAALLITTVPLLAQRTPQADFVAQFDKLPPARQDAVLRAVSEQVDAAAAAIGDPRIDAIRALTAESLEATEPRFKPAKSVPHYTGSETAVAAANPLVRQLPIPASVYYRFGFGTVVDYRPGGKPPSRGELATLRHAELVALLDGRLPRLDHAFAALLRRLDDQRTIDRYAAFLESWANGAETFYDALDRTAGTDDPIFHYDAMLSAWLEDCVPRAHADRPVFRKSSADAQRGFRAQFQNYRSYRSTREMVAFVLAFEGEDALPTLLRRYEEDRRPGEHTMRELVELVLIAEDGDPRRVIDRFVAHAPELREDAWVGTHDAWQGVSRSFESVRENVLARGASTFDVLAEWRTTRRELRARLAVVAADVLANQIGS